MKSHFHTTGDMQIRTLEEEEEDPSGQFKHVFSSFVPEKQRPDQLTSDRLWELF